MPSARTGASAICTSAVLDSAFTAAGVLICDALETLRRGVGVETAFGSFFLCERVPLLVRCDAAELGVLRAVGVFGIAAEG